MVTKRIKVCDITGQTRAVQTYRVTVAEVRDDGDEMLLDLSPMLKIDADLSPKGLQRLKNFIVRGVNKPRSIGPLSDETGNDTAADDDGDDADL